KPVNRPMRPPDLLQHPLRGPSIGEIARKGDEAATFIFDQPGRLVHGRATDPDHRTAGAGDRARYPLPDAGIGTGHHDLPSGKTEGRRLPHRIISSGTGSTSA